MKKIIKFKFSILFFLILISFIIRLVAVLLYGDTRIDHEWGVLLHNLYNHNTYAFYKFEDQTLQLSDDINEISFSLALINYVKVFENVAIQFGIGGAFEPYFTFNENEKLYRVGYDWGYGPILFIDITNPFSKKKD